MDIFVQVLTNPQVMLVAVGFAGTAVMLWFAVIRASSTAAQVGRFDAALRHIAASELNIDTNLMRTDKETRNWNDYWGDLVASTGRVVRNEGGPGRFAIAVAGVTAVGGAVLFGVFGLLGGPLVGLLGLKTFLEFERNKRIQAIDKQLPILLAGLRANLSAQATPQQALMDVAEDMPAPLGDELRALRRDINVNIGLDAALQALSERVTSREVKFLVSSIQIAVRAGAELEPQIAVIQEIVTQRTRIRQKLRGAISQVKPTQYLALGAVPFMFIVSLRTGDQRRYWFGDGLFFLGVAVVLYLAGAFAIRFMIKSVEDA